MAVSNFGKVICLALFSVFLANCGEKSAGGPAGNGGFQLAQSDVEGPAARAFYQARGWAAAWDDNAAGELQKALENAPAHGLRPAMFFEGPLPAESTRRELALTRAALTYASALASGFVDPKSLGNIYTIPRPKPDLAKGLNQALADGDVGPWLESLAPQTDEYRTMSKAFLQFRQLAARTRAATIPDGGLIRPGSRDPRMPAVAAALQANGYLDAPPGDAQNPPRYGPALVAAVTRFQADYGLNPDGVIGADTLDALNRGPADRARRLAVGMERLRWAERTPPATRIDVNTAATFLEYWRDGLPIERRRVVNGEPDWETPQLQSPMVNLVAHPLWRVPDSIYRKELAREGPRFFAANRMVFRDGRLVQLAGPKNSLGEVKFDMENAQSIYLHDTPAKALFAAVERHRSHGCIRVEGAIDFAMMLASDQGVSAGFMDAMARDDEGYVKLKRPIPVRLLYRTAYLDGGVVRLVPDIYGWDDPIAARLGLGAVTPRRRGPGRPSIDIGP